MAASNVLKSQQSAPAAEHKSMATGCWPLAPGRALSLHPRQASVLEVVRGRVWLTISATPRARLAQPASFESFISSSSMSQFDPLRSFGSNPLADASIDLPAALTDEVLTAGDRLVVPAGARVVLEDWAEPGKPSAGAAFRWDAEGSWALPCEDPARASPQTPTHTHALPQSGRHGAASPRVPNALNAPASSGSRPMGADWEAGVVLPLRDWVQALVQGGHAVGAAVSQVLSATGSLVFGIGRFVLRRVAAPAHSNVVECCVMRKKHQ